MKTKHTQGKWKVDFFGNLQSTIESENGVRIAETKSFNNDGIETEIQFTDATTEEQHANAKLIASAPEMLEKLISIKNWLENNKSKNREESAELESIKYLIKQATE